MRFSCVLKVCEFPFDDFGLTLINPGFFLSLTSYFLQNSCSIIHAENSIAWLARTRWPLMKCCYLCCAAQPPLQLLDHRRVPSRCIPTQTKLDCSIAPPLHLPSSIAFFSKQPTFWPIFTAFTLFIQDKLTHTFNVPFHLSLQLLPRQFLFFHLPPLATQLPWLPSGKHHRHPLHHKSPQHPLLHHRHHPRRNANLHHLSKKMQTGMPGMATTKFAS